MISQLLLLLLAQTVYSSCNVNKDCSTGCCYMGECAVSDYCDTQDIGQQCSLNSECRSNNCNWNSCDVFADNQCTHNIDCKSNCCISQYCSPVSECETLLGEGEYCTEDSICYSHSCVNGHCTEDDSGVLGLNEKCAEHDECMSVCCSSRTSKCIYSYQCSNYPLGEYCYYDHECRSNYCSHYHCELLPELSSGALGFISIGLPIIGAAIIAAGIPIMLKCCKKKLMNGRDVDLENTRLNPPSTNVSTAANMVAPTTTPNGVVNAPVKA